MTLPPLVGAGGRPVVGRWYLCGRRGWRVVQASNGEGIAQMAMTMRRMKKALVTGTREAVRARMIWRRARMRPKRRTTRKVRMRRMTLMGMSTGPRATRERAMMMKSQTDQPSFQKGWNLPSPRGSQNPGANGPEHLRAKWITGRLAGEGGLSEGRARGLLDVPCQAPRRDRAGYCQIWGPGN